MTVSVALTRTADAKARDRRNASRFGLALSADVESDSRTIEAQLENISQEGFLLQSATAIPVGEVLRIDLPGAPSKRAAVMWRDGSLHGCRFEGPIPQSAVSAARLRSAPAPSTEQQEQAAAGLIREILDHPGMNRVELASRLGISRPALWAWEKGHATPRRKNLEKMLDLKLALAAPLPPAGASQDPIGPDLRSAFESLVAIYRDGMGVSEAALVELARSAFRKAG